MADVRESALPWREGTFRLTDGSRPDAPLGIEKWVWSGEFLLVTESYLVQGKESHSVLGISWASCFYKSITSAFHYLVDLIALENFRRGERELMRAGIESCHHSNSLLFDAR